MGAMSGTSVPWLRFQLGERNLAIPLRAVSEVCGASAPRLVPQIPLGVGGVLNLRGEPLPVVDGEELLGCDGGPPHQHALVIERETARLGVLVGTVTHIDWSFRPGAPVRGMGDSDELRDSALLRWVHYDGAIVGLVDPEELFERATLLLSPSATASTSGEGEKGCLTAF